MQYLSDLISNVDTDSQFYLFIIDMNDFKRINDKFGHSEGDRSLITAATALKNAANTCRGFTARIGGDEFVLIVEKKQVHDPETIIRILKRNLNKLNISDNLQSDLSFSIGYALCDSPNKTIKQLFAEADIVCTSQPNMLSAQVHEQPHQQSPGAHPVLNASRMHYHGQQQPNCVYGYVALASFDSFACVISALFLFKTVLTD